MHIYLTICKCLTLRNQWLEHMQIYLAAAEQLTGEWYSTCGSQRLSSAVTDLCPEYHPLVMGL